MKLPSLHCIRIVLLVILVATTSFAAEARESFSQNEKPSDAVRKSTRNYANACQLLSKKRSGKIKSGRKSKRKLPKWR